MFDKCGSRGANIENSSFAFLMAFLWKGDKEGESLRNFIWKRGKVEEKSLINEDAKELILKIEALFFNGILKCRLETVWN